MEMDGGRREGKKETMNKEEGINWKKSKGEREVRKDGPEPVTPFRDGGGEVDPPKE